MIIINYDLYMCDRCGKEEYVRQNSTNTVSITWVVRLKTFCATAVIVRMCRW